MASTAPCTGVEWMSVAVEGDGPLNTRSRPSPATVAHVLPQPSNEEHHGHSDE
jgi:hypothetical protein